jgi:hypothetical protein
MEASETDSTPEEGTESQPQGEAPAGAKTDTKTGSGKRRRRQPKQASEQTEPESKPPPDPTFTKARLIAESDQFFGASSHEVAGALAGVDDEELTVVDAQAKLHHWRGGK